MQIVKKDEVELREKEQLLNTLISELSVIRPTTNSPIPKIRFIEEKNIEDHLRKQTPVWDKSLLERDRIWWGFQDHTLLEDKEYLKWIEWYWSRAPKEYDLKLITNATQIEKEMSEKKLERRLIKYWKENLKFTATNWILGEYVILVMTKQHPHYIVEIHDAVYAENMRELFRNLWEMVK